MTKLPVFARETEGTLLLSIKVVPGAKRAQVVGLLGERLKVRVSAPPEGGRANAVVCELLQQWLGASQVVVVAGRTQPEKSVRVEGVTIEVLRAKVDEIGK